MLSTLSINADDVVEDRRRIASCSVFSGRTAFSTPRAPDGCVDGCVKYVDAHVKDYRLSLTQSVIFPGNVATCQEIPGLQIIKERPINYIKDLGDGDRGVHVYV